MGSNANHACDGNVKTKAASVASTVSATTPQAFRGGTGAGGPRLRVRSESAIRSKYPFHPTRPTRTRCRRSRIHPNCLAVLRGFGHPSLDQSPLSVLHRLI